MQENRPRRVSKLVILLSGVLVSILFPPKAFPQTLTLKGEVLNEKSAPVPGALCTLRGGLLPQEGLMHTTGRGGNFRFAGLMPGSYVLTCAAEGYEPISKSLSLNGASPPILQMVLPAEILVRQKVEVRAKVPNIGEEQAARPATLNAEELSTLPGVQEKFMAALPLIPGVIRTPNGRLNIKGVSESQSLLLLDSAEAVDPVTGSFAVDVPTLAIESVRVYKSPYNADFGNFSGGLVQVETRTPADQWRFEFENLLPEPRLEAGHLVGILQYAPRLYLTGPLVSDRLSFSEAFGYDVNKQPVRGLPWPHNEIKEQDLNSFTSFEYIFSSRHLLTANVHVFPLRREFANIDSLIPQPASSNYGQRGYSLAVTDRFQAGTGMLTTLIQAMKFDSYGHGQGAEAMLVTPNGWGGDFFNSFTRFSKEEQAEETFTPASETWHGRHQMTFGGLFIHRSFTGLSQSHPVLLEGPTGRLAEQINFSGPGRLAVGDSQVVLFAQDHWAVTDNLGLDAGLRYSAQSLGGAANFGPRFGFVYSPGRQGTTILRGGFGIFNAEDPLLSADFTGNQDRVVSLFNPGGSLEATPIVFQNAYGTAGPNGTFGLLKHRPDTAPYNVTWSAEIDHELRRNIVASLSYLSSRTYNEFIVDPLTDLEAPALVLSNTGESRYHELDATMHLRLPRKSEWNLAYVQSGAHGDLNTLAQLFVPFQAPVIRPNAFAPLPADVPNRFITWGRFHTRVWGIIVSPVFDVHSGFRYSDVNVLQNYVGPPNSQRFPAFASLDLELGKDFHIPFPWVRKHLAYGELTIFNVTNHLNPRDVYNNIASPFFGHFVGFQHRSYDTSLNIIY